MIIATRVPMTDAWEDRNRDLHTYRAACPRPQLHERDRYDRAWQCVHDRYFGTAEEIDERGEHSFLQVGVLSVIDDRDLDCASIIDLFACDKWWFAIVC